jgi:hypothetical protein
MPTTTWRDLADQLTPGQLEDLEEYDGEIDEIIASMVAPPRLSPREALLCRARRYATENVLDALIGDVPVPDGTEFVDTWQEHDPEPFRIIMGQHVSWSALTVSVSCRCLDNGRAALERRD